VPAIRWKRGGELMASISIHGPTAVNGSYNVIGMEDGMFFLQGNVTVKQLRELVREVNKVLNAKDNKALKAGR
jgi:hypothetical protein